MKKAMPRQAVIPCGGRGVRLGELARDIPKPLVEVGGLPVLDHTIACLARAGVRDFILAAGHLGELIAHRYNGPRDDGLSIRTVIEQAPLGTAGAVRALAPLLDAHFALAYGDVFIDFDALALLQVHFDNDALATLLVRASDHPWDSHLVAADSEGRVRDFIHHREPGRRYENLANAGVQVLSRNALDFIARDRPQDFGTDVYPAILRNGGKIHCHRLETCGFVKDMGTPERLGEVSAYLEERAAANAARARPGPVRVLLLDRDGVLTPDLGPGTRAGDLTLLPGAGEALACAHALGLRCIVITNQPGVARGLLTAGELDEAHRQLRALVAKAGGELEAVLDCPHHPETHHAEGVADLRRACRCRKPAPGLIFRAWREHGVDLASAIMVGDRAFDVLAGRAAGVRTVLITTVSPLKNEDLIRSSPHAVHESLLAFVHSLGKIGENTAA
jgi:mannose-1-phosphate guanylyltransferase / phosphomannomutase